MLNVLEMVAASALGCMVATITLGTLAWIADAPRRRRELARDKEMLEKLQRARRMARGLEVEGERP
jgi:hypothetical protein